MTVLQNLWPSVALQGGPRSQEILFAAFLMAITWGTAIAAIGGDAVVFMGRNLCGYIWVVQGSLAALLLLVAKRAPIRFPIAVWVPWLIWITVRCDFADFETTKRLLMLYAPLVVAAAASATIVRPEALKWALGTLPGIALFVGALFVLCRFGLVPEDISMATCAAVMTLCLVGSYCAPYVFEGRWKYIVLWLAGFVTCVFITYRTAMATFVLTLPLCPLRRPAGLRAIFFLAAPLVLLWVLDHGPMARKMSFGRDATAVEVLKNREQLNTSGRDLMWPAYWEEAWKNPLFGAGANASDSFGRDIAGWAHPHNDYLRVFFDYGIVGLLLLAAPMGYTLLYTFRCARAATDPVLRDAWTVAFGGLVSMGLLAITDNVILYVAFFGCLLFGILGAAHGVAAAEVAAGRRSPGPLRRQVVNA